MPSTASPSTPPKRRGTKRERPSDDTASDDDHKVKKTKSGKAKPRPRSGDELATLLKIALSDGASKTNFEGNIPGRTGEQCFGIWRMTVVPFLYKAVREKGDKKKAPFQEDIKPKKARRTTNFKAAPRKWTADELDTLLTIALKRGPSITNFEGKIEGRTGNQCMRTWLVTVVPFLHKAVREKGGPKEKE
ncbi:hypothetical protein CspHIS471_0601060 [Cutaneotrichosporon sp. HIS471]|nr:hypothetical protein CspHIS471_0601060 [Cutaneotrichosporon sp. HIS471]